jgi:hypothetical protein
MSLLDAHRENARRNIADSTKFGVAITLKHSNGVDTYEFKGQFNSISRHYEIDTGAGISGERANVTIMLDEVIEKTGIPADELRDTLKKWKVYGTPKPTEQLAKDYVIETGGVFPDYQLGVVNIFLTEIE